MDAEDGQASTSRSLYFVEEVFLHSPRSRLLSFILPAPWHFLERLKKIDKFGVLKRPENPGLTGTNEGPAVRDKAIHGICDAFMFVPAAIEAIVLNKTSHVPDAGHGRRA